MFIFPASLGVDFVSTHPLAWLSGLHLVFWASVSWVYSFSCLMKLELGVFVCLFCLFATNYSDWYTLPLSHWKNPAHCFHLLVPCKHSPGELASVDLWDLNKFYVERVFCFFFKLVQFILLIFFFNFCFPCKIPVSSTMNLNTDSALFSI